ncbi:MAG: SDR family oxidoreductase, partial [Sphingobium sp.]
HCDVTSEAEIEAALQKAKTEFGGLDILFNNAGISDRMTSIGEITADGWSWIFDILVRGPALGMKHAVPLMLERGGGSIINMASVVGAPKGAPNRCAYGMSKAAVVGLTKSVAADYVTRGIRCNAICPGTIETPSLHDRLRETGDFDAALAAFKARQPMGRLGQAGEIAALALYLASDESAFMTGQSILVDGGWSI